MGGEGDPAKARSRPRSRLGKPVVTANKALLARHGVALAAAGREARRRAQLRGRGRAAASRSSRRCAKGSPATASPASTASSTAPAITSSRAWSKERLSFADCLKEAQRLGYAEADPTFDIERPRHRAQARDPGQPRLRHRGRSAGRSMSRASPRSRPPISRPPTSSATGSSCWASRMRTDAGHRAARASDHGAARIPRSPQVDGVTNAVTIDADGMRSSPWSGPGAGGAATASAVVADIADIARGVPRRRRSGGRRRRSTKPQRRRCSATRAATTSACRASTGPAPPPPSRGAWRSENISLESIVQRGRDRRPHGGEDPARADKPAPVILITYATTEDAVRRALAAIAARRCTVRPPQVIRIEKN